MARDLNKVMLTGHLGADPEMRFTPQGSAVTTFRVASNRSWKSGDGVQHDDTEWFRIVAWDKLAEICNEYLKKGTRVYIEGRLQTRSWADDRNTGEKRYITEVVCAGYDHPDTEGRSCTSSRYGGGRRSRGGECSRGGEALLVALQLLRRLICQRRCQTVRRAPAQPVLRRAIRRNRSRKMIFRSDIEAQRRCAYPR
jgi:single stranded DNA-binding protein